MALIQTTRGEMDEALLVKRSGPGWVEYWLGEELVHRSAVVSLQEHVPLTGTGTFTVYGQPFTFDPSKDKR